MKLNLLIFVLFYAIVNSQVGINTNNPLVTLDVVGKPDIAASIDGVAPPRITGDQLKAKTYQAIHDGTLVYVTVAALSSNQTGQTINVNMPGTYVFDGSTLTWAYLGTNPAMTNFRSSIAQPLTTNTTADQIITFSGGDNLVNYATVFDQVDNTFTVLYDGYYQMSAFIGFNANRPDLTALQFVAVNLKIQLSTNGGTLWTTATGIRSVFPGIAAGTGTAIQVPNTILALKKGNKLRLVIERPSLNIGGQTNQEYGPYPDGSNNGHVNLPNGQSFTKSFILLKIK